MGAKSGLKPWGCEDRFGECCFFGLIQRVLVRFEWGIIHMHAHFVCGLLLLHA